MRVFVRFKGWICRVRNNDNIRQGISGRGLQDKQVFSCQRVPKPERVYHWEICLRSKGRNVVLNDLLDFSLQFGRNIPDRDLLEEGGLRAGQM